MDFTDVFRRRFWKRVRKMPSGCWEWQGSRTKDGYGQLRCRALSAAPLLAHRVSWMLKYGKIPKGKHVLHRCDNPPCVRPRHLFLGTQKDNNTDRDRKRRVASGDRNGARTQRHRNPFVVNGGSGLRGENHPQSKLSNAQRKQIRKRYERGEGPVALAKEFAVSRQQIYRIAKGR